MSGGTASDNRLFDVPGEMPALMRTIDWTKTALGPVENWSQALRTTVGLLLRSRFPMLLWWGPRFVQLYNDAYQPIPGAKHPGSMGQPGSECWSEIWHIIGPMAEVPLAGGPATTSDDLFLLIRRRGFLEETHFKVAYSPVPDESVQPTGIGGVLATVAETTEQVYAERQLKTLRELGSRSAEAQTAEHACEQAVATLASNSWDVPFALVYLLDRDGSRLTKVASLGFDHRHRGADPESIALAESAGPRGWDLTEVVTNRSVAVFDDLAARFDCLPSGRWADPPRTAIALPLAAPEQPRAYGVLIAGVSPHRTLDDGYRTFYELAAGQVITAIRNARAHEEAQLRADKLAEIDRAKTAFFSNVSHEFRTPLTLILGPLEEALRDPAHTLSGESVDVANRNAIRLQKLVNTLLDFSRIEAGRTEACYEPVDLSKTTTELVGVFRAAVEKAGIELIVRCDPLPEPVWVDRDMWEKIVLNLVSNAYKFTFQGRIEVTLEPQGATAVLRVRDTGTGVAPEEVPRLFERFYRIAGTRARTHEGSGIGLALVQALVAMHGGTIKAESEVGVGSVFTVVLRFGKDHLPHDRLLAAQGRPSNAPAFVQEASHWTEETSSVLPRRERLGSKLADRHILLADDNSDMRSYVARLLREEGATVETVADGEAALRVARSRRVDLVLTDVMMPVLDGFGLIRALRSEPATRAMPIIMLSARAGEESRIGGLESGADDYIVKPFSSRELVARVAARLEVSGLKNRLAEERATIAELFARIPVPVAILRGKDFVYEMVNTSYSELLRGRQVVGRPLREAVPELEAQGFDEILQRTMLTGTPYVGREQLLRVQHGNQFEDTYWTFVYAPIRGETPELDGIIAICNEVTEQVSARHQLEVLATQAEAANRAKDEFLAMLGHELRNPLSPILTALQLLRLRGKQSHEQDIIERQVGHLARLVDDLLDVSRITQGKIELRRSPMEMMEAVTRAIETTSPLLEQRRHDLNLRVPKEGLAIDADRDRMAQVISNLLTNASKYSEPGSRIDVEAWRADDTISLRVRDQGVGIPPDMISNVFDRFVQQPQTLDRSRGGLGLGLAIVRSLVEMHGGTVVARSEGPGRGSEFTITLPAVAIRPSLTQSPSEAREPNRPRDLRILVVDDNHDAASTLQDVLETLGYQVKVAHDGPSALSAAKAFQPSIALLDIGLPVMDGYELAQRLRDQASSDLRMVAVTGYGQDSDRQRSLEAGFLDHLVKPVDLTKLERVIERLVC